MNKIKLFFFVLQFAAAGCTPAQNPEQYYAEHKSELKQVAVLCDSVWEKFDMLELTFRYMPDLKKLQVGLQKYKQYSTTVLFGVDSLDLDQEGKSVIKEYEVDEAPLKRIAKVYLNLNCKAISISEAGVFFTINGRGMKIKHPDSENGLLFTSGTNLTKSGMIKKIDDGVYVYDMIMH